MFNIKLTKKKKYILISILAILILIFLVYNFNNTPGTNTNIDNAEEELQEEKEVEKELVSADDELPEPEKDIEVTSKDYFKSLNVSIIGSNIQDINNSYFVGNIENLESYTYGTICSLDITSSLEGGTKKIRAINFYDGNQKLKSSFGYRYLYKYRKQTEEAPEINNKNPERMIYISTIAGYYDAQNLKIQIVLYDKYGKTYKHFINPSNANITSQRGIAGQRNIVVIGNNKYYIHDIVRGGQTQYLKNNSLYVTDCVYIVLFPIDCDFNKIINKEYITCDDSRAKILINSKKSQKVLSHNGYPGFCQTITIKISSKINNVTSTKEIKNIVKDVSKECIRINGDTIIDMSQY